VLKPGGRVLACVDSLTHGMALLAQQHQWPHLVDLPNADVVLVPWPDGTISRCYGTEQLNELFTTAGFQVSWIRPRTVFSSEAVAYLLGRDPGSFARLLNAELQSRSDDSVGDQLIVNAVLPRGDDPPGSPRVRGNYPSPRIPPGPGHAGELHAGELSAPAVAPGLAGDAAGGGGARFQPLVRHQVAAVHAVAVAAVIDPCQRRQHLRALRERGLHGCQVPVGLGQVRASVASLRGPAPDQRMFTL
jgi:hypothetical protein